MSTQVASDLLQGGFLRNDGLRRFVQQQPLLKQFTLTHEKYDESETNGSSMFTAVGNTSRTLLLGSSDHDQQVLNCGRVFSPYSLHLQPFQFDSPRSDLESRWLNVSDVLADLPPILEEPASVSVADIPLLTNLSWFPQVPPIAAVTTFDPDSAIGKFLTPASPSPAETPKRSARGIPKPVDSKAATTVALAASTSEQARLLPKKESKTGGLKRSCREPTRKKVKKSATTMTAALTEQVEHVLRERQRRDDMSSKISTLERLLPPGPKRDRASIVHGSIQYVKSLQREVEALQKTRESLKQAKITSPARFWEGSPVHVFPAIPSKVETNTSLVAAQQHGKHGVQEQKVLEQKSVHVEFHVRIEGPGKIVDVAKCKCRPDYLSSLMRTLERLRLDIRRCSVTKMLDHFICVVVVKPQCSSGEIVSSTAVATSLKDAVES